MKSAVEEKLKILKALYKSDFLQPFPYRDCEKILTVVGNKFENFVPSLDLYFSDVAGHCSWGEKIAFWSVEKVEAVENQMQKSFFDRFPKLSELKDKITDRETPQLYNQFLIYNLMRLTLADILSELKAERYLGVSGNTQLPLAR